MTPGLLTAGSGQPWENGLVAELGRPGAPFAIVRRCVDVAELLAVAATGQADVVLVDADLRRLSSDAVQRLVGLSVSVVGVHRAGDAAGQRRLELVGIPAVVADDVGPTALIDAARQAIAARRDDAAAGAHRGISDPSAALLSAARFIEPLVGPVGETVQRDGERDGGPPVTGAGDLRRPGRVVAVWGPTGAPGRTTVAVNLAAELAASGADVLLVDGDCYGGVVANALGLLDESPGLAGACRLAAAGRLDAAGLAGLCWQVGPMRVLTGIARADRWPELRPSAIPIVLERARASADLVVVDCGFAVEADEELSFDTAAPRRNGSTLAVLADADAVLAVGSADPPGMERLVRGLANLAEMVPGADPRVVLNRQRRSAAGADEAAAAVARFTGLGVLATLPEDRAATDKAWSVGAPLCQAAPASPLRRALSTLAGHLAPTGAGRHSASAAASR